jgi:phosphate transport system substrate-binding protein
VKFIFRAALLLCAALVRADTPVPATVEFMFDPAAPQGVKLIQSGDTSYLKSIQPSGGAITNGWWHVEPGATFGQGAITFEVDRSKVAGDLALVLRADWQSGTDIAVQLFDAEGRAVALDLFGETHRNAQTVGTDTFIVPLNKYPDATSIVVRRLSGDLRLVGGGLYPVLSEITSTAENEKDLAQQLGVIISPHHWLFSPGSSPEIRANPDSGVGQVHALLPLERTNQVGAVALRQGAYPAYQPLTSGKLVPPKISSSNTTEAIINNALRMIALRTGGKAVEPSMTSSDGVAMELLKEHYDVGFMSVPLSSAEKESFFRDHGYPPVELTFARDALAVLVNSGNSLKSITIPQLDAIYGTELRAGAPASIQDWGQLGAGGGAIKVIGGALNWGTTRTFQQLVLKGGPFRSNMSHQDVVYSSGVEKGVSLDSNGIGFATLRPRTPKVRAVAVAPNSGEPAYGPDAAAIYGGKYPLQRMFYAYVSTRSLDQSGGFQRELLNLLLSDVGQTLVARSGTLPLMATEVKAERAKLGLP